MSHPLGKGPPTPKRGTLSGELHVPNFLKYAAEL
jgi:hypothetical protein